MQCGLLTRFDSRRLTLQHGKVTVLHTLSHISSQDASLSLPSTRPVIDTKMYSTPSAVDDKRGFSSSLSRWMGMNSPMLLPRTILCAVTHTHTSRWIVVSRAHTHTLVSVNLAGSRIYHLLVGRGIWPADNHQGNSDGFHSVSISQTAVDSSFHSAWTLYNMGHGATTKCFSSSLAATVTFLRHLRSFV